MNGLRGRPKRNIFRKGIFMVAKVKIDLDTLKSLRAEHSYSISDLANLLGYKTPTGYWLIEQGSRKVSIDTLYRLSEIYGCHMEDLVTLTGEE